MTQLTHLMHVRARTLARSIARSPAWLVLSITMLGAGCGSSDSPSQPSVASVTVSGPSTVHIGQTIRLTATAVDANGVAISGQTFTWSSDNTSVASVAADGTVTGKVPGNAAISATVSIVSGSANVTVTP